MVLRLQIQFWDYPVIAHGDNGHCLTIAILRQTWGYMSVYKIEDKY